MKLDNQIKTTTHIHSNFDSFEDVDSSLYYQVYTQIDDQIWNQLNREVCREICNRILNEYR